MFEMKAWLDEHVVPLTKQDPPLRIYSFIWNGNPPKEILVWLLASEPWQGEKSALSEFEPDPEDEVDLEDCTVVDAPARPPEEKPAEESIPRVFDPTAWPRAVKRLIDDGWRFDYLREQQMVRLETGLIPVFGGDGAPLYGKEGTASCRLFRKMDDGISLILQVGCHYPGETGGAGHSPGEAAAAAVKGFFGLFEENPLVVCQKYGAQFGQA